MKQLTLILGILFFLPCLFALGISPSTVEMNQYAGECRLVPLTITNPHETDLVSYLYYTTDLEDTEGLELRAENPFIARKGETQIPLQVCTTSNFAPATFDLNLYADANIQEKDKIITQIEYRGGTNWVYLDKNIIVDRNIIIQVPKEIIKEKIVEKIVEKPVEKIVEVPVTMIKEVQMPAQGLFGLASLSVEEITIVLLIVGLAVTLGYFTLIKPKQGIEN